MWHTKEIGKIFADMTKEYGYEILQNRKRCTALCGDLLAMYDQEKKVFMMLFQAGLGESLREAPFRSEREAKIGIMNVEKFLKNQGIADDIAKNVVDVVIQAFAEGIPMEGSRYYKPIVCKNYNDVHFKLKLPTYTEYEDHLEISSVYMYKSTGEAIESLLEKSKVTDRVGIVYSSVNDYQIFSSKKPTTKFSIAVQKNGKKLFLSGAKVELSFLCSNQKRIVVSYFLPDLQVWTLQQISIYKMNDSENKSMQRICNFLTNDSVSGKAGLVDDSSSEGLSGGGGTETPLYTSTSLTQYSEALKKEISFLKQGKGKKYKIVNGERLHRDNKGIFTYSFEMETELHLPDDAPVTIEATNGLHAVGSVLLCDDFQITLMLDRDLTDKVGTAYITVEV